MPGSRCQIPVGRPYSDIRYEIGLANEMGTDPVTRELQKGARELQRNAKALESWSGVATEVQIAAVRAIENLIVALELQEEFRRALKLRALRELGQFLLLARRGKGRPRKPENVLSAYFSRPTYRQLGITKPHIARDALIVGAIPAEVLHDFLALNPADRRHLLGSKSDPTIAGLVRYAMSRGGARTHGFFLTNRDLRAYLEQKYGELVDVFPHPRPPYDALQISWAELKKDKPNAAFYVNAPFVTRDWEDGYNIADVVRKCIEEAEKGVGPIILVMPTRSTVNMLLEARKTIDVELESLGRPVWLHTETHKGQPSPPPSTLFVLDKKPASLIPVASESGLRAVEMEYYGRLTSWTFPVRGVSDYLAK
jgi:hypothetical protein